MHSEGQTLPCTRENHMQHHSPLPCPRSPSVTSSIPTVASQCVLPLQPSPSPSAASRTLRSPSPCRSLHTCPQTCSAWRPSQARPGRGCRACGSSLGTLHFHLKSQREKERSEAAGVRSRGENHLGRKPREGEFSPAPHSKLKQGQQERTHFLFLSSSVHSP